MYDCQPLRPMPGCYADAVVETMRGRVAVAAVDSRGAMRVWSAGVAAEWPEGAVQFVPDGQPPLELAIVAVCAAKRAHFVAEAVQ